MAISPLAALQESNRRAAASANWSVAVAAVGTQKEDQETVRVQVAEWRLKSAQQQAEEADARVARAHEQVTQLVEHVTTLQRQHEASMANAEAIWQQEREQLVQEHREDSLRLASLYEEQKACTISEEEQKQTAKAESAELAEQLQQARAREAELEARLRALNEQLTDGSKGGAATLGSCAPRCCSNAVCCARSETGRRPRRTARRHFLRRMRTARVPT